MNRIDMVNEGVRLMLRHRDTASAVEAILDMAEPLIRNQIAAEIRAQADRRIAGVDMSLPCMTAWERGYDQATDAAVRIARGTNDE